MISIQIIHHENECQKYLDNLLRSLRFQTYKWFEVIIMDSTENGCKIPDDFPNPIKVYRLERTVTGPKATTMASQLADPNTKYHLWCNDDLIFNAFALEEMVVCAGESDCMVNPMSNCDLGWLYILDIEIRNKENQKLVVQRFMDYETVRGFEDAIIYYARNQRIYIPQTSLCMYSTLIPAKTLKRLGGYDERFLMGYNDTDMSWCYRNAGVPLLVCMSAFVWHYGGATTKSRPRDRQNQDREYFKEKWGLPDNFDGNGST